MRLLRDTDRLHEALMLALCFVTGVVDAVGYLGLDRVFTANMTGNVVILAMALTGAKGLQIVGPVVALAGFVVGAMGAGRVLRDRPAGWTHRDAVLLVVSALLLVAALVVSLFGPVRDHPPLALPITAILGLAMGVQGGTARHVAVADVPTVVITSTLVGLALDSWLGRRVGQRWVRRLLAVVLVGLGALVGALLLNVRFQLGLGLATLVLVLVAATGLAGQLATEREQRAASAP